ncbi:type VI secretion system protein [Escherichia coli]|nr:type VI secretion system protein [Escherichia coli]
MGAGLYSGENPQKIRSKFNIEESYCAIKTNGVLGFSNRMNA